MLYEIRHYGLFAGKFDEMVERFKEVNLPLFEKYGITLVKAWSDPEKGDRFSFLMSYEDLDARTAAWEKYHQDPVYLEGRDGQKSIIETMEYRLLSEIDFAA